MKNIFRLCTGLLILILFPQILHAQSLSQEQIRPADVRIWSSDAKKIKTFTALPPTEIGGGYIASGDVNGDGVKEIIIGSGLGSEPLIQIFTSDGTKIRSFFAYLRNFKGGVRVASGDVNGDGVDEIITAPGPGEKSKIRIFDQNGNDMLQVEKLAYVSQFLGGTHIATIDINNDGKEDIITSPGPGGGPHIRIFDGEMTNLGLDFFAYDKSMTNGVTLTTMRSPEGPSIVTAIESWDMPLVRTWVITENKDEIKISTEFLAFDFESRNGIRIGSFDFDNDKNDEIVATRNGGTWPEVRIFDRYGTKITAHLLHDPTYRGTLSFAQLDSNNDTRPELAVIPTAAVVNGPVQSNKFIRIDISEQRLYAYENGRLAKSFLISSGLYRFPTPVNWTTSIKEKIFIKDYKWIYSANSPYNYNLPNVKYNLNIGGPFYIHYAYWHNNFGKRMSHGCINTSFNDAKWIYTWADVGTPVETVP